MDDVQRGISFNKESNNENDDGEKIKVKFKVFDVSDFKTHYHIDDIIITILCKKN